MLRTARLLLAATTLVIGGAAGVTPASAAALSPASCPSNIVEGDTGSCVSAVQQLLWNWGYGEVEGSIDGDFGQHTFAAVEAFQRSAGIGVDGQVGPQTEAALHSMSNPTIEPSHREMLYGNVFCLDADTNTRGENGQIVQLWDCNGTSQQDWEWVAVPYHSGEFMMVNMSDGLCLDADTTTAGNSLQKMQNWTCNGQTNQEWTWSAGTAVGILWSVAYSDRCMEPNVYAAENNGTPVWDEYPCFDAPGAQWYLPGD